LILTPIPLPANMVSALELSFSFGNNRNEVFELVFLGSNTNQLC
jgi:hypothetical protein